MLKELKHEAHNQEDMGSNPAGVWPFSSLSVVRSLNRLLVEVNNELFSFKEDTYL